MKTTLALQARMGSSRLPQKALRLINRRTLLECIVGQVKGAKLVTHLALATSDSPQEKELIAKARGLGLSTHVGAVDDIVGRLFVAAQETDCDVLVRIWGDCAFICPDVIDEMILHFVEHHFEFLNNENYPGGLDVEIYSRDLLNRMNAEVRDLKQREFPVEFVKLSSAKRGTYRPKEMIPGAHLTIDYLEDLVAAEKIYSLLESVGPIFTYNDLVHLFRQMPALASEFSKAERNIEYNRYLNSIKG